jgi:hypothetical protein
MADQPSEPGRQQPRLSALRRHAARRGTPGDVSPGRSLAAVRPDLARELRDLDPSTLGINTRQEVQWRCPDCEHEWRARVRARAAGSGCPRCARASAGANRRAHAAAARK